MSLNFGRPTALKRILFFLLLDILLLSFSFYLSFALRFNFEIPPYILEGFIPALFVILTIKLALLSYYKVYFVSWRFFGLSEAKKMITALFLASILFGVIYISFYDGIFARSIIIIDFFISFLFIGALRISKRVFIESTIHQDYKPTIIIGANTKTTSIIKSFHNGEIDFYPVAIVSAHRESIGTYLSNIKVFSMDDLEQIIDRENIQCAIITKNYSANELDAIFDKLTSLGVGTIKVYQVVSDKEQMLKNIAIEDLLAREPKDLDMKVISDFIKDKRILITGAGGSIGSEIARQCASFDAKTLYLVDNSEYNLYKITEELQGKNIQPFMKNVADFNSLQECFEKTKPQIVIHAAAYKHVPLVEHNPKEAIINNIIGTKNCIDLSIAHGVEKFILISTDKAVRPTNVMGATKRVCELYAGNVDAKGCEISAVRFGNVLGSSGSVIPKFRSLIEQNKPLPVTHPEITRYFMLIPEACQLVLQAATLAKGGELFVLDMGESVKIVDLAKKMLRLYGKDENNIIFTGLRPAEKLYEELLIDESDKQTKYRSIFSTTQTTYDINKLQKDIKELVEGKNIIEDLQKIIPEFKHNG
jgi:UDP-N-acetyl-D-glucosamine 4,6-dehydratase